MNAVKRFERNHHLRANGRVNQRVWNLVARAARAKAARPKPLPPPTGPAPAIVGHRGAVTPDTPENTLASMHRGAAYAAVLEFDLRLTADHQIVLMHDVTLDRTTNCTGRVIDWTLADLRAQCHVGSQPIPTFDEVAAYAETTTLKIAPEIKNADISDADLGQVFSIIDAHGLQGRTIMQSFEAPVLQRVHALRPDLRLMLVSTNPVTVAAARAAYATTVAIRLENLTAAQVANYKRNSMKVWTFTAIDNPTLDQAHRIHADAVITDIPGQAKAHYGELERLGRDVAAHRRVAGDPEPPRPVGRLAQPDARAGADLVDRLTRHQDVAQVEAVVVAVDGHRLAEPSGATGQVTVGRATSSAAGGLDAVDDLAGAQQDRARPALRSAGDVAAEVHAVGEVDVEVPGRSEHHRVAVGAAVEGVRAGVVGSVVRLHLGEPDRHSPVREGGAEQ